MSVIKILATEEIIRDQRVMKEAQFLSESGNDIEILCWDRENEFKDKEIEYVGSVKIKRFFPKSSYGSGWKQIGSFFKFITMVRKYLRNDSYDFLHCQNLDAVIMGRFLTLKKHIVFDMRELYLGREGNYLKRLILKMCLIFAYQTSWKIIHVNQTQISEMSENIKDKLVHLPNYPQKSLGRYNLKTSSKDLRIGYIGGVRQGHIFINLFEATKFIENIKINIHGGGTSYSELKQIESNYHNVSLTGRYNPKDTGELFSQCDVLYCVYAMKNLNWKTAYPIKFYEAIITKTPVIVSKGSVLESFLEIHDIGFVVDGENIDEIRNMIVYINSNRNILEEKKKNIEKIQFEYCWETVVKNLNQIY